MRLKLPPNLVTSSRSVLRMDERTTSALLPNGAEVPLPRLSGRQGSFRVEAGDRVEVRLPKHALRGSPRDLSLIVGHNGVEQRVAVRKGAAEFELPADASGRLSLVYEVTDRSGRLERVWTPELDGRIAPSEEATVLFGSEGAPEVHGTLRAGDRLRLAYDSRRLEQVLGVDAPELTAKVAFDGGSPLELPLSVKHEGVVLADPTFVPEIQIPYGVKRMETWFEGRSGERLEYDSNYGRNFGFDVGAPRVNSDPDWKTQLLAGRSFPKLTRENFDVIAPRDAGYDCFAWSLGKTTLTPVPGWDLRSFDDTYGRLGYTQLPLDRTGFEPGIEKVALYAEHKNGRAFFRHVALMDAEGNWTSKLGHEELIRHDALDLLEGDTYGQVTRIYGRPRPS